MSIEYTANLDGRGLNLWSQLSKHFSSHPKFETISLSETELKLRFKTSEWRDKWPEDLTISVDDGELYVGFYSATQTQIKEVIDEITNFFLTNDSHVSLEEV